jgi:hypothetical protein
VAAEQIEEGVERVVGMADGVDYERVLLIHLESRLHRVERVGDRFEPRRIGLTDDE